MSKIKIITPRSNLIEKVASEFAGVFYDAARSSGLTVINLKGTRVDLIKLKTPRVFARRYLEKFIADAVQHLTALLGRNDIPETHKLEIYEALMERVNDPQVDAMGKAAGLPEFQSSLLYKDDSEKPKPIIVNTVKDMLHGKASGRKA